MSLRSLNALFFEAVMGARRAEAFLTPRAGTYRPISLREFALDVERTSLGLGEIGIERGDRVAILSENRYEWAVADYAILTAGAVAVPIYPTLPSRQVDYILQDSGARALFVSGAVQLEKVIEARPGMAGIRTILSFDPVAATDTRVFALADLQARGEARRQADPESHRRRGAEAGREDVATILYTSGTTGPPKGVMLSHGNILSNVESALGCFDINSRDTCLSILPLSHVFERMAGHFTMLHAGVTIAYAESLEAVPQNLLQVRPTIVVGVPRFFEKIYHRAHRAVAESPASRRRLFVWAKRVGRERTRRRLSGRAVPAGLEMRYRLADALVFRRLRQRVGGRLRFFVSGGAPLARSIAEFFFAAGLPVYEGYGLTETSPVLTANTPAAVRLGTVGRAIPGVAVRVAEDGEILASGPNVMRGYWQKEEATREALVGGWFRTGDIGVLDADGFLTITDRKKDLIVTAGGKNVAPQPIENLLRMSPYILEAVVIGDGRRFIGALLMPRMAEIERWAASEGIGWKDHASLFENPRVRALYEAEIASTNRELAPYEQIRRFDIIPEEPSQETGELTPTLKIRRSVMAERFADRIERLYSYDG
jgi:long-chain acyl-CoA synthetase